MPPGQEQSMSYAIVRLRQSVHGNPYSSPWDFTLNVYNLGKKMDFHRNTYLLILLKHRIKNAQSILKAKLELSCPNCSGSGLLFLEWWSPLSDKAVCTTSHPTCNHQHTFEGWQPWVDTSSITHSSGLPPHVPFSTWQLYPDRGFPMCLALPCITPITSPARLLFREESNEWKSFPVCIGTGCPGRCGVPIPGGVHEKAGPGA